MGPKTNLDTAGHFGGLTGALVAVLDVGDGVAAALGAGLFVAALLVAARVSGVDVVHGSGFGRQLGCNQADDRAVSSLGFIRQGGRGRGRV